ncbi:hypothetical protein [Gallaecimonas xiamenensis]|uniref:hypothetical protein n=1 Tax=Gallaecimonas xiamenensis TaxID=1207039 RepID=UPI0004B1299B|nr:hypothetical protein [Gallaecimonas xiamenensis]
MRDVQVAMMDAELNTQSFQDKEQGSQASLREVRPEDSYNGWSTDAILTQEERQFIMAL